MKIQAVQLVCFDEHPELFKQAAFAMGWEEHNWHEVVEAAEGDYIANLVDDDGCGKEFDTATDCVTMEIEFDIKVTMGDSSGAQYWYVHRVPMYEDKDGNFWADVEEVTTF